MARSKAPPDPFSWFDSSPEVIRLVVLSTSNTRRPFVTIQAKSRQAKVGRWKNDRAENSHLPFRRRERAMARFRRMKTLQKFSSVHAQVQNHFSQERHLVSSDAYNQRRSAALAEWRSVMA